MLSLINSAYLNKFKITRILSGIFEVTYNFRLYYCLVKITHEFD